MSLRYSLVLTALAALAPIVSMIGQTEDILAQNQTQNQPIRDKYLDYVPYESPTTVILSGSEPHTLGLAIDTAIQIGYKVDSVTVVTESDSPRDGTIQLTAVYTVFMTKG